MKKIYFLIVFCFFYAATTLIAQQKEKKITKKDSLKIETYYQKIETLKNEKKYPEMIKVREEFGAFLKEKEYWERYFESQYYMALSYGLRLNDKKEEEKIMKDILYQMQAKKYQNDIFYAEVNFRLASKYLELRDLENAKKYFYITKDLCEKNHPKDYLLGDSYTNLMVFYSNGKNRNIDSINFYLDKSFVFLKRVYQDENKEEFARYYQNKGASLTGEINNHKKALVYLTQSNKIYKNLLSKKKEDIFLTEGYVTSFISLGNCYNHLKEYEQANSNYLSAIEYLKVIKIDLINEIILYSNIAKNNVKLSDKIKNKDKKDSLLNEASNFLNKAIDLCINKENYQDILSSKYIDMANLLIKQGKLKEADSYFLKAENILKKQQQIHKKSDDFAELYSSASQ
jgi:tetratricopeptide (TPR) repeat protein